ncbi:MAG: GtrA family protein [Defluviicoccus sp.]
MLARLLDRRPASREALAFAVVGSIGFGVDAGGLVLLFHALDWGHYASRGASFLVAVTVTWYLNRTWTFAKRGGGNKRREYSVYFLVQVVGACINGAVYALGLALSPAMQAFPLLALACGSIVAMAFNFLATRRLAFPANANLPA